MNLPENLRSVLRGKSDTDLRAGGFYLDKRQVTKEECAQEQDRRRRTRAYAAEQKARGEY